MVVGNGLPVTGSGIVFGASTSLPFTLTLILSIGGVAGSGTSVAALDILESRAKTSHSNLPSIEVHDWENHFVVAPHQIPIVHVETLESSQLAILSQVGVLRPAQKRLEIREASRTIVENQTQFVA
jgi:hypothetical protein